MTQLSNIGNMRKDFTLWVNTEDEVIIGSFVHCSETQI